MIRTIYLETTGQLLTQGGECVQGERLRKWREKEKMSQEELAEKSNVSRTTIHLIESGQSSTVKIRTLQKLAVVFNKQVKDFFLKKMFNKLNKKERRAYDRL